MKVRIERHYRLEVEVPDGTPGDEIFSSYDPRAPWSQDDDWRETHRTLKPLPASDHQGQRRGH